MCIEGCVKFVVFAFNLIFVLVGAGLIAIGTFYKLNYDDFTNAIPEAYDNLGLIPILTIVVGSVIFLIAFFGCCGAIRGSPCLLTTYAVILLTIFILQIALGVFTFLEINDKDDLKKSIHNSLDTIFSEAVSKNKSEFSDFLQQELSCCGTDGNKPWSPNFPSSCYLDKDPRKKKFKDGCDDKFYEFLLGATKVIGIVVLVLAATEVLGAILSLCLANSIRNESRRQYY